MVVGTLASGICSRGDGTCPGGSVWWVATTGGGSSGGMQGGGVATADGGVVLPCGSGGSSGGMRVGNVATEGGVVISTRQSRAPVVSRVPVRMGVPAALRMRMFCLSKCAVQPASQSWPRLRRLLVNPGMICTWRTVLLGKVGKASWAEAVEVCWVPVAVRMVVGGA